MQLNANMSYHYAWMRQLIHSKDNVMDSIGNHAESDCKWYGRFKSCHNGP